MSGEPLLSAEDVAEIIAILDGTAYEYIDVQTTRVSLRIARSGAGSGAGSDAGTGAGWTQQWQHRSNDVPVEAVAAAEAKAPGAQDVEGLISIRPPLPGMFYRAPQPGAADFVAVGDVITADTIIGIIETMKVMNSIPAGVAGEVTEIIVPSGTMVDKTDILMRVRAAAP